MIEGPLQGGAGLRILGGVGNDILDGGREKDTIDGGNGTGDCAGGTVIACE